MNKIYLAHGNDKGSAVIDPRQAAKEHTHYDEFWELFSPDVEKVDCPLYLISSLADNGVHTPGSIRGFLAAQSSQKYMESHPKVLDGPDRKAAASVEFWPPVRLQVTDKHYAGSWRSENELPIARIQRTKFFLSPSNQLTDKLRCLAENFSSPTETTGTARLHLPLSISEGSDADLFVTLQKLDRDGNMVHFPYHSFINDGYVAWGWLKASKRKLAEIAYGDEVAHTFLEKNIQPLQPGEKVQLDISIQPSATLFRIGESLRVVVQR
ncbi:hypothetical protein N7451_002094 [Penicillium sp. IBT 35674x]|nr:hypothetical protein N7451_002094 [Penicillium sp. IBT 35674x]